MNNKRYERVAPGIERSHRLNCAYLSDAKCNKNCPYRAEAYDRVTARRAKRTFATKTEAQRWRDDMRVSLRSGAERISEKMTLAQAWAEWERLAKAGVVKSSDGDDYKPQVLRNYEGKMRNYILPHLGRASLGEIRLRHVQDLVDHLVAKGQKPKTVRNTTIALRAVLRWAIRRELLAVDPCLNLALPSGEQARERVAPPAEAIELLGALRSANDRAVWATAFFTGLRRGELQALRWERVDLINRRLRVEEAFDVAARRCDVSRNDQVLRWLDEDVPDQNGAFIRLKTKKAYRWVPIPDILMPYLVALDRTEGLVFGPDGVRPFNGPHLSGRAQEDWSRAGLEPITMHGCRHTYVSLLVQAGVRIDVISEKAGHSSVTITLDRYRHLLPGTDEEVREQFNEYLAAA